MVFNGHLNELDSDNLILVWLMYMILRKMCMQDSLHDERRNIVLNKHMEWSVEV